MAGAHTLQETEHAIQERLGDLPVNLQAMAGVSNIYRAAGAVRNHLERTVLAPHDLTWTGWVVLWVIWVWKDIETRHVASEAGISKGTLTGVARTLESRGWITRRAHPDDRRRVLLALTVGGQHLMTQLFPAFNEQEALVTGGLSGRELEVMTRALRKVVLHLETLGPQASFGSSSPG